MAIKTSQNRTIQIPDGTPSNYVKATTEQTGQEAYFGNYRFGDPRSGGTSNSWRSTTTGYMKFCIQLEKPAVIKGIRLVNYSEAGVNTDRGIKSFEVHGTNNASDGLETAYGSGNSSLVLLGTFEASQHPATNTISEEEFSLSSNTTRYEYIVIKILGDNWGATTTGLNKIAVLVEGERVTPNTFSTSTVKATTEDTNFAAHQAINPSSSKTGAASGNAWRSTTGNNANQKYNIDFGEAVRVVMMELENYHDSGADTDKGFQVTRLYGTDSATAFNNTSYSDLTDLDLIEQINPRVHTSSDEVDRFYNSLFGTNNKEYRYYVVRIESNRGDADSVGARQFTFYNESLPVGTADVIMGAMSVGAYSDGVVVQTEFMELDGGGGYGAGINPSEMLMSSLEMSATGHPGGALSMFMGSMTLDSSGLPRYGIFEETMLTMGVDAAGGGSSSLQVEFMSVSATGSVNIQGDVAVMMERFSMEAFSGGAFAGTMQPMTMEATAIQGNVGVANVVMPYMSVDVSAHINSVGTANLLMRFCTMLGEASTQYIGTCSVMAKSMDVDATGHVWGYGIANLIMFDLCSVDVEGRGNEYNEVDVTMGVMSLVDTGTYIASVPVSEDIMRYSRTAVR